MIRVMLSFPRWWLITQNVAGAHRGQSRPPPFGGVIRGPVAGIARSLGRERVHRVGRDPMLRRRSRLNTECIPTRTILWLALSWRSNINPIRLWTDCRFFGGVSYSAQALQYSITSVLCAGSLWKHYEIDRHKTSNWAHSWKNCGQGLLVFLDENVARHT